MRLSIIQMCPGADNAASIASLPQMWTRPGANRGQLA